jgi:hemoglobin
MVSNNSNSLFEQLGGMQAVDVAVNVFYAHVMNDERINYFFRWVDMETQSYKMKTFLAYAFGAPINFSGKSLKESHSHLVKAGLNDEHFDAVIENLIATLRELGIAEALIEQVGKIAESTRDDILRSNGPSA